MTKCGVIFDNDFLLHDAPRHPETANRLRAIKTRLESSRLIEQLSIFEAPVAKEEDLLLAHPQSHINKVRNLSEIAIDSLQFAEPDTYVNRHSFRAALKGVGGLNLLCQKVMAGELDNGFNLSRPPGHHAERERMMGFCLFSTTALGALHLLNNSAIKKVAIFDFDVHHGNGTEDICANHPDILFISTYQKGIFPMTNNETHENVRTDRNNIVNYPLSVGTDDETYLKLLDQTILPALTAFKPDFLIVSAGYDAHSDDPLAELALSSKGFGEISLRITRFAIRHCKGRVVFNLEGGYNLSALAHSVENSLRALLGDTEPDNC